MREGGRCRKLTTGAGRNGQGQQAEHRGQAGVGRAMQTENGGQKVGNK